MSISGFLGLCHHNELEEGVDLATASSSNPLPPFPSTRLCNYLCDVGHLQQKSLGDLCHHPHESWGNRAHPKRGCSGFSAMQQAGQPTHRPVGICGAEELCPGNCSLPAATPDSCRPRQGLWAVLPLLVWQASMCWSLGCLLPSLLSSPPANGALKRGLIFQVLVP